GQVQRGFLEVVVGERVLGRSHLLLLREQGDDIVLPEAHLLVDEPHVIEHGAWMVGARAVGDHHRVLAILVLEEEEDSLLLQQASDEVVVRLAILHAVLARLVGAELEPKIGETVLSEDLLDDVRHRIPLKDAAVRRASEEPRPGDDLGPVLGVLTHRARLRETAHDPVQESLPAAGRDRDGDVLPDDGVEVGADVAPEHLRLEVEEGRDPLGPAERRDEQRVATEGSLDLQPAVFLGEVVCHPSLVLETAQTFLFSFRSQPTAAPWPAGFPSRPICVYFISIFEYCSAHDSLGTPPSPWPPTW